MFFKAVSSVTHIWRPCIGGSSRLFPSYQRHHPWFLARRRLFVLFVRARRCLNTGNPVASVRMLIPIQPAGQRQNGAITNISIHGMMLGLLPHQPSRQVQFEYPAGQASQARPR
jgi:hypothetical protein